jgi:hypothetical protein
MEERARRFTAGIIRVFLVLVALAIVGFWISRRLPDKGHVTLQAAPPSAEQLGPGDYRLLNTDSSMDVILQGDHILVGLSPKTVARIKASMDSEPAKGKGDSSDFGNSIAQFVKKTVADKLGTHLVYSLADLRDVRFDNGHLLFEWKKGAEHRVFENVKVNGKQESNTFPAADADAFIAAVRARKVQLGQVAH